MSVELEDGRTLSLVARLREVGTRILNLVDIFDGAVMERAWGTWVCSIGAVMRVLHPALFQEVLLLFLGTVLTRLTPVVFKSVFLPSRPDPGPFLGEHHVLLLCLTSGNVGRCGQQRMGRMGHSVAVVCLLCCPCSLLTGNLLYYSHLCCLDPGGYSGQFKKHIRVRVSPSSCAGF